VAGLQAEELFACLDRQGVECVLIGGLAAVVPGLPLPTLDADICPSRADADLERLAAALHDLDARIRTPDSFEGARSPHEAAFLANVALLNLVTRAGDLDLSFTPAGTRGFDELLPSALPIVIQGVTVRSHG
jgi:hypothetical protein